MSEAKWTGERGKCLHPPPNRAFLLQEWACDRKKPLAQSKIIPQKPLREISGLGHLMSRAGGSARKGRGCTRVAVGLGRLWHFLTRSSLIGCKAHRPGWQTSGCFAAGSQAGLGAGIPRLAILSCRENEIRKNVENRTKPLQTAHFRRMLPITANFRSGMCESLLRDRTHLDDCIQRPAAIN